MLSLKRGVTQTLISLFFLQNRAWPSKGWVESWGHIGFGVQRELEVRN